MNKKIRISTLIVLLLTFLWATNALAQSPFRTRENFADINGARIFYTITGRDNNEPLVLIHGYPLNGKTQVSYTVILNLLTSKYNSLGEIESSDNTAERIIVPGKEKRNR